MRVLPFWDAVKLATSAALSLPRPDGLSCLAAARRFSLCGFDGLLTEPVGLGLPRANGRVVRRYHRVVGRNVPLFAILRRSHPQKRKVPLQRSELLAVLEANNEIRRNRLSNGNGGLQWLYDFGNSIRGESSSLTAS